jgi:hypothetical protein
MRAAAGIVSALILTAFTSGCGHHDAGSPDAPPWLADAPGPDSSGPPDANLMPATLLDTGLCVDAACKEISPGVHAFAPRWTLWSDGATKRRWIYLPPGAQIDTTDMDTWHFPVGTKLWKEFTRGTVRVETRLFWKYGPTEAEWFQVAYVWNADQTQAVATPAGAMNANGTEHDVPGRIDCKHCHERTGGRILGFSAIQLDYDAPSTDLDLRDLVQMGALTKPPTGAGAVGPYFPLWSDASANDVAAIGYLHANCGHCHNAGSDVVQICPRLFKIEIGQLAGSKTATDTYATTVHQTPSIAVENGTYVITPHDADHSALFLHFTATGDAARMPPLATEIVDPTGQQVLHDWITAMPTN